MVCGEWEGCNSFIQLSLAPEDILWTAYLSMPYWHKVQPHFSIPAVLAAACTAKESKERNTNPDVICTCVDDNPFCLRMRAQDVGYFPRYVCNSGSGKRHCERPLNADIPHNWVPDDQGRGSIRSVFRGASRLSHPATHTRAPGVVPHLVGRMGGVPAHRVPDEPLALGWGAGRQRGTTPCWTSTCCRAASREWREGCGVRQWGHGVCGHRNRWCLLVRVLSRWLLAHGQGLVLVGEL